MFIYDAVSELMCSPPLLDCKSWGTTMKMAISFICGVVVCGLILFGIKPVMPTFAEDTQPPSEESDNVTQSLTGLVADIERIYRDALTMPFIKAESKIYDEDIADYYRALMEKTGLTDPNSPPYLPE